MPKECVSHLPFECAWLVRRHTLFQPADTSHLQSSRRTAQSRCRVLRLYLSRYPRSNPSALREGICHTPDHCRSQLEMAHWLTPNRPELFHERAGSRAWSGPRRWLPDLPNTETRRPPSLQTVQKCWRGYLPIRTEPFFWIEG